jgi:hypothetical protein
VLGCLRRRIIALSGRPSGLGPSEDARWGGEVR